MYKPMDKCVLSAIAMCICRVLFSVRQLRPIKVSSLFCYYSQYFYWIISQYRFINQHICCKKIFLSRMFYFNQWNCNVHVQLMWHVRWIYRYVRIFIPGAQCLSIRLLELAVFEQLKYIISRELSIHSDITVDNLGWNVIIAYVIVM